jgi:hypothetical protein
MVSGALIVSGVGSTIVWGAAPQLNEISPPPATAVTRAVVVQLVGVPSPTTFVSALIGVAGARNKAKMNNKPVRHRQPS